MQVFIIPDCTHTSVISIRTLLFW